MPRIFLGYVMLDNINLHESDEMQKDFKLTWTIAQDYFYVCNMRDNL